MMEIKVKVYDLFQGLRKTLFLIDKEDRYSELDVVCLNFSDEIEVVASDGQRLALYKIPYVGKIEKKERVLLHYKDAEKLKKLLFEKWLANVEWTSINTNEGKLFVSGDDWHFEKESYRDRYTNYKYLVNNCSAGTYAYEIDRMLFLDSLRELVAPVRHKKLKVVHLYFGSGKCVIKLEDKSINLKKEINVKGKDEFEVYVNADYLIEGVKMLESNILDLRFNGNRVPFCMKENRYMLFIMPMAKP